MVRWVVGSILHWRNHRAISRSRQCSTTGVTKGRGICYPVCGMVHIKDRLLLIGKSVSMGRRVDISWWTH